MQIKLRRVKFWSVSKEKDHIEVAFEVGFDFDNMNVEPKVKEGLSDYVFVTKIPSNEKKEFEVWHERVYPKYNWLTSCCNKRGGGRCPYFEAFGKEIFEEVLKQSNEFKEYFKEKEIK